MSYEGSETEKYRELTAPYCRGNGLDLGSGGHPVVPNAISVDLPKAEFEVYHSGFDPLHAIHLRGDARKLHWFNDGVLDWVYASHLLEDFADWEPVLREWIRVLKQGGHIVILVPDRSLFAKAVANGQPPNCAHKKEGAVGELTGHFLAIGGVETVIDQLTALHDGDYSILYVGRKA